MEEGAIINEKPKDKNDSNKYPNYTAEDRRHICVQCPLYIREVGVCNPHKWLNPETMETKTREYKGFFQGCGCRIESKVKKPESHCNAGLW